MAEASSVCSFFTRTFIKIDVPMILILFEMTTFLVFSSRSADGGRLVDRSLAQQDADNWLNQSDLASADSM